MDNLRKESLTPHSLTNNLGTLGLPAGLEVNFLEHLQSFASAIFFPLAPGEITSKFFSLCLGDMDDSKSQTFASGYFSHWQIIKITRIFLRVHEL